MRFGLHNLDRRVVFALVFLSLAVPLLCNYSVPPAPMPAARMLFDVVEKLEPQPGKIAFVAFDFGPNTKAENEYQAEVVIEHLMRRRIPVAVFTLYQLAPPFLVSVPERVAARLMREHPDERWEYGRDWVNLGFLPGGYLQVQAIPKSKDLKSLFIKDVRGNKLQNLPIFRNVQTLEDILFLAEFTGLKGIFDVYVQFFQKRNYAPVFVHGCTSITIPEAFIYLESGQIQGLLEGIAGAAWYSKLLSERFPSRAPDQSAVLNTGLGVAHLVVILLIVAGNIGMLMQRGRK